MKLVNGEYETSLLFFTKFLNYKEHINDKMTFKVTVTNCIRENVYKTSKITENLLD